MFDLSCFIIILYLNPSVRKHKEKNSECVEKKKNWNKKMKEIGKKQDQENKRKRRKQIIAKNSGCGRKKKNKKMKEKGKKEEQEKKRKG